MDYGAKFAKYYDKIMGDRSSVINLVREIIKKNKPEAKKLLELACGTGELIKGLSKHYDVYGLDLSSHMMRIAKQKIDPKKLFLKDMTKFKLENKFDVIICLFDSINHLLKYEQWEAVFKRVKEHLTKEGLFIFDMNVASKLKRLAELKEPHITNLGKKGYDCSTKVAYNQCVATWTVTIKEGGKSFTEKIKEVSFPLKKVEKSLKKLFNNVEKFGIDDEGNKTTAEKANRVYFVCN